MGVFDISNYIVNTGIIEQFFQCTTKVILLAKMIKLWAFYENVVYSYSLQLTVYRMLRHRQEHVHV